MNNFELCRKNTYERIGFDPIKRRNAIEMSAEIRRMVQRLEKIVLAAKPRLIMGGIRYGSNWKHRALMDYMQTKFNAYRVAGNYEMLIDLVNLVAVEGELKTHPKHHLSAIDRKE